MALIAQYLFESNLLDETVNNNDGTLNGSGTATYRDGVEGKSFEFDGSTHILIGDTAFDFERTDPFSFTFWMKTSNVDTDENLFGKTDVQTSYQILLNTDNELQVVLSNSNSNRIIVDTSGANLRNDEWHHIAVTYDGSSSASGVNIFVDGELATMSTVDDTLTLSILHNDQLTISNIGEVGNQRFTGRMDNIGIYDEELTSQAITNLFGNEGLSINSVKLLDLSNLPSTVREGILIRVNGKIFVGDSGEWRRI